MTRPPLAAAPASAATLAAPDAPSAPATADLEILWHDACLWEVGSNNEKVPAARQKLVEAGDRALDFMIPAKLDTKDTLVTRALQVVVTGIGKSAVSRLVPALDSPKPDVRRNAADLLGALGAVETAPAIARLLSDPDARLGALSALAALKAAAAVPDVARLIESDAPERVRYTAAATLGSIGGPAATDALARQLGARSAPLRFAAQYALEQLKAVPALRLRLDDPDLRVRLHAIAALGHIADPAPRDDLRRLLGDPSPLVRGFAAEALGAMLTDTDRSLLKTQLDSEKDPFARGKLAEAIGR